MKRKTTVVRRGRKAEKGQAPPARRLVAFPWYSEAAWTRLRATAEDADGIGQTYAQWVDFANRLMRQLRTQGVRLAKVDVDIEAFEHWRQKHGRPNNGDARGAFAASQLQGLG